MQQIERITQMEQLLEFATEATSNLTQILNKYTKAKKAIDTLSQYYSSKDWKQDYADDEAGLIPKELKRGVLSEDGIYNLLSNWNELEKQLRKLTTI